ncbi:MAG TPA: cupin domain-containing protein [Usitatibacter sp.]|nr:cupin domain-containing protein [Usitatibacter sp.]
MEERAKATRTAIEDNHRVTITEWRFAPGAETGWHRHPLDYVVVYRTAGRMRVETKDGASPVEIAEGASFFRKAGIEHNVINTGDREVVFVETEIK